MNPSYLVHLSALLRTVVFFMSLLVGLIRAAASRQEKHDHREGNHDEEQRLDNDASRPSMREHH